MNKQFVQKKFLAAGTLQKFQDPDLTAKGEPRARVELQALATLWFNTGSLCNIECVHCYTHSSPRNDYLVYLTLEEVVRYLDEIAELALGTREIGFTGGEPFMNPDIIAMIEAALSRGFEVLILSNAMRPMQRPGMREGLLRLKQSYRNQLTLRVSLDHYRRALHDKERGEGSWEITLRGLDWLSQNGFQIHIAGRTCWGEDEHDERAGYARLIAERGWAVEAQNPGELVLFPEMDEAADVPEITTGCWELLDVKPQDMMCASSRMVLKRKGAAAPAVVPCTLLLEDEKFEMAATLAGSMVADGAMFDNGAVKLNHPHCAKFCVLGGGACS